MLVVIDDYLWSVAQMQRFGPRRREQRLRGKRLNLKATDAAATDGAGGAMTAALIAEFLIRAWRWRVTVLGVING
jgi:hypothetical protein